MSVQVKELLNSAQSSPSDLLTAELCMARILAWGGPAPSPSSHGPRSPALLGQQPSAGDGQVGSVQGALNS